MADTGLFAKELTVFEKYRKDWSRSHPGEFVAIQDDVIVEGFFSTYGDALRAGLKKFGAQRNFLVKQIWKIEPVYFIS